MGIGAIVVLFFPTESQIDVLLNLKNYAGVECCIVDNSPECNDEILNLFGENYIFNANKGGIAGAFNAGCRFLFGKGVDFVFLFDQDSNIPSNFFEEMMNFARCRNSDFVCPDFLDVNSGTQAKFVTLNKWSYSVRTADSSIEEKVTFAISSGSGLSRKIYLDVGSFNEDYFIDHVDTDYCLRAWKKKYGMDVNANMRIYHAIGRRSLHKFMGLTIKPNRHSPLRRYYIIRNGIHSSLTFFWSYPSYFCLNLARTIHEILSVLIYENNKIQKMRAIFWGAVDGFWGRLGECRRNF